MQTLVTVSTFSPNQKVGDAAGETVRVCEPGQIPTGLHREPRIKVRGHGKN